MNEPGSERQKGELLEIGIRALQRLRARASKNRKERLANKLIIEWYDNNMGGISMEDLTNLTTVKESIEKVYDCGNSGLFQLFLEWLQAMDWIDEYEHYKAMV
jgi:hypothetical protein